MSKFKNFSKDQLIEEIRKRDEAIKNFHKVYYSADNDLEGILTIHHAAAHVFDAAGITSTQCESGRNAEIIEMAIEGKNPPKDCVEAWARATGEK